MNFETLLKQIVKEAVVEAFSEVEPKNWTTNDIHEEEPHNEAPAPSVEPEEEVTVEEPETEEVDLGSMKLKELREYAEELGLNSKGKRAEVEDRIREFLDNQEDSEDEEVEEPEVEEESEEPEIEENEDSDEDEDSEVAEDDEVEDETYAKVMQYVNEASDDELRETLEELGLSSKGKREALVEKIYQAVKDGLFEFEEEEPSEDVEPEEEADEETSEDLGITEERAKAIVAMEEQVQEEFEEGKITRKEMVAYLKQVGIAVTKKVEDEAVVEMYTEKLALLIDDEGEFHDEGGDPYNINEVPYCCGAPLEEIEGGYRCNVCGTEYEAE
jgi:HAM group protein|uniref:Putative DNA-binding motif protein n=1 Tax=Myoviridae sp. ctZgq1 TaxID=2826666 RepID=A0A8S5LX38_9CAUD|nr:MAG TPA: putative DNA-binding motif protein [Myoviridae sp. ctZgq1]